MAEYPIEISTPRVPNFVRLGGIDGFSIKVGDLPDNTLKEIGADWTRALIENAQRQRLRSPTNVEGASS